MQKLAWAFPLFWLALICGCASVKTLDENGIPSLSSTDSGVAFNFELKSEDAFLIDGGCQLNLRKDGGLTDYAVPIHGGEGLVFASLAEGSYRFHDFYCSRRNSWELHWKPWPSFKVRAGKISVLPNLSVRILDNKQLSADFQGTKLTQPKLLALFGRLSEEAQARVISGFTGDPVILDLLRSSVTPAPWEALDMKSGKKLILKRAQWPSFKACYRGEAEVNKLWLGELRIVAHYQNRQFSKLEVSDSLNSFSSQFSECAKTVLKNYQPENVPRNSGDLKYEIFLYFN